MQKLSPGFLCGWGLFETMRAYNRKIIYFDEHLKRIRDACKMIKLKCPYPVNKLKEIIRKAVKRNASPEVYVKLMLYRSTGGTEVLVITKKFQPYPLKKYQNGFRAHISKLRANEHSFLTRVKCISRLLYELSFWEAKEKRFDEAIILNIAGCIAEGSRSNIFWVKNDTLFTPSPECGCLGGITRKAVLDLSKRHKIKVKEGRFYLKELLAANEAFLTNSLMGIMPLVSVEKRRIGNGLTGNITKFLWEKYRALLG